MKTILTVEVNTPELCSELKKEIDIPFFPEKGTRLQLSVILSNHPNTPNYKRYVSIDKPLVTGVFTVEDVVYQVDKQRVLIRASENCETEEESDSIIGQLTYGYGFSPG